MENKISLASWPILAARESMSKIIGPGGWRNLPLT